MTSHSDRDDLSRTEDWLRAQRPELTGHDLDRIKQRAVAQATREPSGSTLQRPRRAFSSVVAALALAVGVGGAFAIAGNSPPGTAGNPGSAAKKQYLPGKGCGDKNHVHAREGECKKPPR